MSYEEEAALLKPFEEKTEAGQMIEISEIKAAYFSDVPLNQYYAQAASWAAENSIATGYGDGRYGPDDPITREQIVAILMNYAQFKGMDTNVQSNLTQFSDRDLIDDYAWDAMVWANAVGVINGKGGGILDPDGPATRAEVATILTKFCPMIEEY